MYWRKKELAVVVIAVALALVLPAVMLYFVWDSDSNALTGLAVGLEVENEPFSLGVGVGNNSENSITIEPSLSADNISLPVEEPLIELPIVNETVPVNESFEPEPTITIPDQNVTEPAINATMPEPAKNETGIGSNKTALESAKQFSNYTSNNTRESRNVSLGGEIRILALPVINSLLLNTTDLTLNGTDQNITANVSTSDADAESVKVTYNWRVNRSSGPGEPILVLNMPFERINGTNSSNAWDYSGYGNSGTENGGIVFNTTGGYDSKGAYEFKNAGNFISMSTSTGLNITQNITISAWIKKNGDHPNSDLGGAIAKWSITNTLRSYLLFEDSTSDQMEFAVNNSFTVRDTQDIPIGEWHHYVGRYNGTHVTIFRDGIERNSSVYSGLIQTTNLLLTIGRLRTDDGATFDWNGVIDDVMIFNRSLSASQIWALFNNRTDLISYEETTTGQN